MPPSIQPKLDSIAEIHSLLFNIMVDGVLIVDSSGKIIDCNHAFHQRLGYGKEELIGSSVSQLDPPEFAARVPERMAKILDEGQAVFETAHYRKDGSIMPVEINARLIEIEDESCFVSIVRDISERKALDRALREKERMYRAVVESSEDGFWAADIQGRIIEVNDAYLKRSGYSREEMLEMHISDLEAAESPEETAAHIKRLIETGHDRFESRHKTKSGDIWPVEIVTTFWPLDGGIFLVFTVDITERKKAEAELNKLSQAIAQAGEGVMITDPDGMIEYINPAFTNITGYRPEEAIGQRSSLLKSGAQAPPVYEKLWQTITQGDTWEGRLIDRRKDGTFYPAMISIAPVSGADGKIIHYVSIQKDMSEFKRLENQVLQAQKMEALGTLVGGIAHDFNNMLAAVQGNVYLARMEIDDRQSVTEKLRTIDSLSEHAASVVKQLLTFAKKDIVEMEPVALNNLITEEFKLAKSAIPENISHVLDICQEELVVNADITQLQQAVINLSNNARDAVIGTEQPLIEWSLRKYVATDSFIARHPDIQSREFAQISVWDNGCGIDDAYRQAIFDPFFTTKEPGKGTGLGLAMVYGSVERHGGILEVESETGKGTAFHIYLPLMNTPAEQKQESLSTTVPGSGETILLVDDEGSLRKITSRVLNKMSYNIIEANDGEEAISLYHQHRDHIDMIITDIVMPGIGGVELAEAIRRDNRHIPIILATGYDREQVASGNLQIDNCQIISKPFPYESLSRLIRKMLSKN